MTTPNAPAGELKRFYKEAELLEDAAGFGVALDGRAVKTPAGGAFRVPTRALGSGCAREWAAQGAQIAPITMPLTQLAFAALDHTPGRRGELIAHVAKFGETDLVCHRADAPAELVQRQAAAWDALLAWAAAAHGFAPPVVVGILPAPVPDETLAALRAYAAALDDFRLTALAQAAGLAGSAVIALAMVDGHIDAGAAYAAATVDDLWSLETWGEDEEARARLDSLRLAFDNLASFIAALAA